MRGGTFYSKLLLFGEYSIIKNSMALAIPFSDFSGRLDFNQNEERSDKIRFSQNEIQKFFLYIKNNFETLKLRINFDLNMFEEDIQKGLYFNSTIPEGFGVGSSGALCAAIFDAYLQEELGSQEDLGELKNTLSFFEAYFHGQSSGLDPLISYINRPLLMRDALHFETTQTQGHGFFLVNTNISRKTGPFVKIFLDKCKDDDFDHLCHTTFIPLNNACIQNYLVQDFTQLQENFKKLSSFQWEHLREMVPASSESLWRAGLESGLYSLKLCGAGGGGFLLGLINRQKEDQIQQVKDLLQATLATHHQLIF